MKVKFISCLTSAWRLVCEFRESKNPTWFAKFNPMRVMILHQFTQAYIKSIKAQKAEHTAYKA